MRRLLLSVLILGTVFTLNQATAGRIVPELEQILQQAEASDMIKVIVQTREQADLSSVRTTMSYDEKLDLLKSTAQHAQAGIKDWLSRQPSAKDVRSYFLVSRMSLTATPAVIRALAARDDVSWVGDDYIVEIEKPQDGDFQHFVAVADETDAPPWNITLIKADSVWALGYTGAGVVVGTIDTGVFPSHPAFGGRMRSTDNWFDGVAGQTSPYDDNGHGTHTMGSICGGDGPGPFANDIGVAPGATFIAAKAFNSSGSGQASWINACFDWMANTGRPNVCSNSWGSSSRTATDWVQYVQNLRDLGIVVVFSIGNSGPNAATSGPPGSYPMAISAGAVSSSDAIASFSSRGPAPDQSPWNDPSRWSRPDWNLVNPTVCAPGVNVNSAAPNGGYQQMSGTSMACPHVAGAAALLLSVNPLLTHDEIFNILADNADHVAGGGSTWPNNNFGWGRINCYRAVLNTPQGNVPNLVLQGTRVTGDNNSNGRLDPGETGNVIARLRNSGAIPATAVLATLRTSDSYVTITDSLADFGTIVNGDTANNANDVFTVTASAGTPEGHSANFTLYLACMETTFTRTFSLFVGVPPEPGRVLANHDTGYCKLTVSAIGTLGYDLPAKDGGSGFCYPKTAASGLYFGGIVCGNSASYVVDRYYGQPASSVQSDWTLQDSLRYQSTSIADQTIAGSYTDAGHSAAKGLKVLQTSYQSAQTGYDKFVTLVLDYQNNGASPITGLYSGVFCDFDIGSSSTTNTASTNSERRAAFMRQSTTANPTMGVKLLYPQLAANLSVIDHALYVYPTDSAMTESMKYRFLNGTLKRASSNRAYDWSVVVSAGPFDLSPGATTRIAYAIVGGSDTNDFLINCDSAQSWYDGHVALAEESNRGTMPAAHLSVSPNPTRSSAVISYTLPQDGHLTLRVYDINGRQVATLLDRHATQSGSVRWNTTSYSKGLYFIRAQMPGTGTMIQKLLLVE